MPNDRRAEGGALPLLRTMKYFLAGICSGAVVALAAGAPWALFGWALGVVVLAAFALAYLGAKADLNQE